MYILHKTKDRERCNVPGKRLNNAIIHVGIIIII